MHLLELVRTSTGQLKAALHRLALSVIKVSAKDSEAALRSAVEETPKYVQLLALFQEEAGCEVRYMLLGFFYSLMIHILELIPVCLSTPNRSCYLGQTAVLVLIEADISFIYGFHSSAFFRVKSPLLATADIQLWRCDTGFSRYLCCVTCVCTIVGYSWGAAFQMELLFCLCGL